MHDSLIKYINSYLTTKLTYSEKELIKNTFAPKKLRKRQYFLQEGEVFKYAAERARELQTGWMNFQKAEMMQNLTL